MMSSTHDREHGQAAATANQVRDGENQASLTAALRWKSLEIARNGFAGATAGAVSRVLTAPFDVAKIRFQLDHGATRRYRSSVWAAMRSIYGEEGLVTLWRGNLPAMFLWSAYAGVQFCAYEQLRTTDFLNSRRNATSNTGSGNDSKYGGDAREGGRIPSSSRQGLPGGGKTGGNADGVKEGGRGQRAREQRGGRDPGRGLPPAVSNFVYGSLAAFTATLLTYPLDITRTALAFQGVPKRYKSVSEFMGQTLRKSGPRGLFRGVTPTVAMITPQMGISFAVWEALKDSAPPVCVAAGAGAAPMVLWQLWAGAIAGMVSKLAVFPLDTVKKRVQTAVMLERDVAYGVLPKYTGPFDALETVLKEEGAWALFRGSAPAMWKSGLSTAITYAVYEWVRAATGKGLERY